MMQATGANLSDRELVEVMRRRAVACVRRLVRQGAVVEEEAARGMLQ